MTPGVAAAAAGAAVVLTGHAAVNARLLRRPPADPPPVRRRVSLLLPLRDEAHRVEPCLRALTAQRGLDDAELLVLDDGSTDGTADVVRRVAPQARLLRGTELRPGWLGKPHACQQLADAATGDVLVFVDADVVLRPHAVAASVALLDRAGLDLVSPYPRQETGGLAERLVQPLLQWSWLTLLPLRLAERSPRPSLSAANGQLLAVRREAYVRAGGHRAVRRAVLEDVALVRRVKAAGGRGGVADGTDLATCRMYDGWADLRDGYAKSLWAAGGTPLASAAQVALLLTLYVLPPVAALRPATRTAGLAGYAAGVAGRVVAARRTGGRCWPDALAHPVSVLLLARLTGLSWWRRARGTATWKGRAL